MSKQPADSLEPMVRQIREASKKQSDVLAGHTRQLESLEAKLDRVLDMLADEAVEFEDEFESGDGADMDGLMAEIEKLPPDELKRQFARAVSLLADEAKDRDKAEGEEEDGAEEGETG
jgi:hypothetical protein